MTERGFFDADFSFIVSLVGTPGCGKSRLLQRFAHDSFSDPMFCVEDCSITMEGKLVNIRITETRHVPGLMEDNFGRNCRVSQGIILVYDVTDTASFDDLKGWYDEVKGYVRDEVPFMVVGNKIDLASSRKVSTKAGRSFATKRGMLFMETSAKTSENVSKVFVELSKAMIKIKNKEPDAVAEKPPPSWTPVKSGETVKCVVICNNSEGIGLLYFFTNGEINSPVFDNPCVDLMVDGTLEKIHLCYTNGEEDFDRLRPLSYSGASVFLMMFSINDPDTFSRVSTTWGPEVNKFCPGTPVILVGVEVELRDEKDAEERCRKLYNRGLITHEEGTNKAKEIGAAKYIECSTKTMLNVKELFEDVVRAAHTPPKSGVFSRLFSFLKKK